MNLLSRAYAAWSLKTPSFPRRLQIETTNRCNAACLMCPILAMSRPKGEMDFSLLDQIAQELAGQPPLRRVILHVMGEPLLNPDFIPMLHHLKRIAPHQPLEFSTNGSVLSQEAAQGIIEAGVEAVNFSLDAASAETYAKIRRGLNFDKVQANLTHFIEAVAASGQNKPRVIVQLIKMDVNQAEWGSFAEEWRARAGERPFVELYVKEQWSWGGYLDSGQAAKERAEGFLALPCGYPFDQLDVYWDGRVGFCCLDEDAELEVGDLKGESLAQVWRSPRLEDYRRRFKRLDFNGLRCADCGERLRYRSWSEMGQRPRRFLRRLVGRPAD